MGSLRRFGDLVITLVSLIFGKGNVSSDNNNDDNAGHDDEVNGNFSRTSMNGNKNDVKKNSKNFNLG